MTGWGFPSSLAGKESACNAGDLGWIPGLGRFPGGGHGNPLQYSCLENPHGHGSLAGYRPWDHKESDITEHLSTDLDIRTVRFLVYFFTHPHTFLKQNWNDGFPGGSAVDNPPAMQGLQEMQVWFSWQDYFMGAPCFFTWRLMISSSLLLLWS